MAADDGLRLGKHIRLQGVVQGVGFRPFVFDLAQRYFLTGWVCNTSAGVDIEVDGGVERLDAFVRALVAEAPPLASIDDLQVEDRPANGFALFEIRHSRAIPGAFQPVSPDVGICDDCLRELFDPRDRRYRYPFINCTHCGPRFTIIHTMPYDRPSTTMASFPMCPDCAAEYQNPQDRRFHAQPVACPVCGPQVWFEHTAPWAVARDDAEGSGQFVAPTSAGGEEAIRRTRQRLAAGNILAVKGLGGFHLACDATNGTAVSELRRRKSRMEKPLAVMVYDLSTVEKHCLVNNAERELLLSRERPIVILRRRPDSPIAAAVAPGQFTLGVMLPYTPLHYLLLEPGDGFPEALVMTSGNRCEEPIATDNDEAQERLADLADAFLLHNRDIHIRCDDSVVRIVDCGIGNVEYRNACAVRNRRSPGKGQCVMPIRRARGDAPLPVKLSRDVRPILATGAELKNTFCLARGRDAFLSQHIGDLENMETLQSFEQTIGHFERLFRIQPERLAYDLHPDYLATRYALARAEREGIPALGVQHHHAHIAACMAEHGLPGDRPVIGVAFDGTGYGDDGRIWGGEFLVADYTAYERPYHFAYVAMPGGDAAVREPWRLALSWLDAARLDWEIELPPVHYAQHSSDVDVLAIIRRQLELGPNHPFANAPLTSSIGRLFDAVAALIGLRQVVTYEAQAAVELEALVDLAEAAAYPMAVGETVIDPAPLVQAVIADWRAAVPLSTIAARFHNGLARMVADVCQRIRIQTGLHEVVLSGGVWQNVTLLRQTLPLIKAAGFAVYWHQQLPTNDGGLALGQAAVAAYSE